MERMTPPATRPPNAHDLTPEELDALRAQGWQVFEDGSLRAPDGSGVPAYDSPNDFPSAGGFGSAPSMPPATAPPAGPPPSLPGMGMMGAEPNTLNASIKFANPMGDALPDPFEAPEVTPPLRAQPAPDLKAASSRYTGGGDGSHTYGGRVGRRMQQRGNSPDTSRRRR